MIERLKRINRITLILLVLIAVVFARAVHIGLPYVAALLGVAICLLVFSSYKDIKLKDKGPNEHP